MVRVRRWGMYMNVLTNVEVQGIVLVWVLGGRLASMPVPVVA